MSFNADIERVRRAERALETHGRVVSEEWLRLRRTWRSAWTPGRIVIAGIAGGFLIGRNEPAAITGSGFINLVSALGSLFAVDEAAVVTGAAEGVADDAADEVADAAWQPPPR